MDDMKTVFSHIHFTWKHTGVEEDLILILDAGIYTGFENDFHEFSRKPIDKAFRSTYTNEVCM